MAMSSPATFSRYCRRSAVLGALAVVVALSAPRSARAQARDQLVQVSLSADLLSYERHQLSSSGEHVSIIDTAFGPSAAGFGFEVGVRPSENYLLGLQLLGSSERSSDDRPGTSASQRTSYAVLPRVEYLFAPDQPIAPYAGATLGMRGSYASSGPGTKVSSSEFTVGGIAGLHLFAAHGFSIDPNIALLASVGNEELGSASLDRSGFTFLFGISFSGWLNTGDSPPPAIRQSRTPGQINQMRPVKAPTEGDPEPGSELASAPPLKVDVDGDGAIRSEIWIGPHQRLRLLGRPISDGNAVLVTLIDSAGSNTRPECTEFHVIIDGLSHAIQPGFRAVPGSGSALQSLLSPAILLAMGEARQSAQIEACGSTAEISGAARGLLREFFEEFRSRAERYGHPVKREPSDWSGASNDSNHDRKRHG